MKALQLVVGCLPVLLSVVGCTADERWEGTLTACSTDGYNNDKVLLIVDSPRAFQPTGWAGRSDSNNVDTWLMAQLEKTSDFANNFKYSARFDIQAGSSHSTEDWKVDITKDGFTKYKGEAEILATLTVPIFGSSSDTVRCKISFTQVH